MSRWLDNEHLPYTPKLLRIAALFGVSVDYLTDDVQDDSPAPELKADEREILCVIRASDLGYQEVVRQSVNDPGGS